MTKLGATDIDVFPLCLGTNVFGWTIDEQQSHAVLDAFAEAGGNFLDTADVYAAWGDGNSGGESEQIIGNWMAARGNRDKIVVGTKVGQLAGREGLSAETVVGAAEDSLRRLQTDYIDLYYAHIDDRDTPLEETLGALDELVKAGKVRAIAASNYSADRLGEALAISDREGLARYAVVQPHYNLIEREEYENGLRTLCVEEGISCVPYFALAKGFLTGKYKPDQAVDTLRGAIDGSPYLKDDRASSALSTLVSVADEQATSPAAVALAWLLTRPAVAAPIASARNVEQLESLLGLDDVNLTEQQLQRLDVEMN
jgi:aryl-alcohol dehydrogenase-like predicted oxidoreductase